MNKEFIPYEEALALKELGFIEPVIAYFKKEKYKDNPEWLLYPSGDPDIQIQYQKGLQNSYPELGLVSAPLYQQAFRWFREKYQLYQAVYADKRADDLTLLYKVHVYKLDEELSEYAYRWAKTYEEAEQACLDKLIKLVKEKK